VSGVRRTEVHSSDTVGVVFEPGDPSEHYAIFLGGSFGGIPEAPARKLAENGVNAFALGYFAAAGLPAALVEIPLESLQSGLDWFRRDYAGEHSVGLMGFSKGAELALVLAAEMGDAVGRTVAVAPSHVVWLGLKEPGLHPVDRRSDQSSWSFRGEPLPFLPCPPDVAPVVTDRGLRTDAFMDLSRYTPEEVDAARIAVERASGPILLLSGDDDHQWPAAPMAAEVVARMENNGRAADITNVVYPGAGHMFLVQEFLPQPTPGTVPLFDYGGSEEADRVAGNDAWQKAISFLKGT
jgi:dienelactone hydrolase